jgi:hypothetical protein
MTLLIGGISLMLAVFSVTGICVLGRASGLDARAQIAADAAALAAVSEWTPGASSQPEVAARRYAELNDGRLLSCICPPSGDAAQVKVVVGGVIARARAVFDPSLLGPLDVFAGVIGLRPEMGAAVSTLIRNSNGAIHIVSGYRTTEEQARLWADAVATYGSPESADDWVAPPGESMHEAGLAVDLGGDLALANRLIDSLGLPLHDPLANEPWHFELIGSRPAPS